MMPISAQSGAMDLQAGQSIRGRFADSGSAAAGIQGGANALGNTPDIQGAEGVEKGSQGASGAKKGRFDRNECQTCKNRTYQDGSDDPGVSFKTPTKISPQGAASAVVSHEREHVARNQVKAKQEGREVISQTVSIHMALCSECGKSYVSGGTTRTVTGQRGESKNAYDVGLGGGEPGQSLNQVA